MTIVLPIVSNFKINSLLYNKSIPRYIAQNGVSNKYFSSVTEKEPPPQVDLLINGSKGLEWIY